MGRRPRARTWHARAAGDVLRQLKRRGGITRERAIELARDPNFIDAAKLEGLEDALKKVRER